MDYQNTLGLSNTSAASTAAAEAHEQMDVEELDLQSGPSNESEDESMSNLNSTMIHDEGFSLQAVGISNPSPVEPSIDDDDGVDFDDDEAEDDKERGRKRIRRKRTDFQWKYQINVTCLILPALEGVDAVLEQMQRMTRRVKLRA